MIPELGHFSLIIGLAFAMLLAIVPLVGVARKDQYLVRYAWPLSYGMFFFIFLSVVALGYSFAVDDFSEIQPAPRSSSQREAVSRAGRQRISNVAQPASRTGRRGHHRSSTPHTIAAVVVDLNDDSQGAEVGASSGSRMDDGPEVIDLL